MQHLALVLSERFRFEPAWALVAIRPVRLPLAHARTSLQSWRLLLVPGLLTVVLTVALSVVLGGCYLAPDPPAVRPEAVVGPDQPGEVGEMLLLSAEGSSSPRDAALTYHWSFEALPEGSLLLDEDLQPNHNTEALASAFEPDRPGLYVVRLVVDDGVAESRAEFVAFDVAGTPERPVAEAGADQQVTQGMVVYFDGSSSRHPLDAQLYYKWSLAGVPELSKRTASDLQNPYTPYPSLMVDTGGVFTLSLVVSDGINTSEPDYVFITVLSLNSVPEAHAGGDQVVDACTWVTLDGGSSFDLNGDALSYDWRMEITPVYSTVGPSGLVGADDEALSFYADKLGTYIVSLRVSDGASVSVPDTVRIDTRARLSNTPPEPDAGEAQTVLGEVQCNSSGGYCPECPIQTVELDGTRSTDEEGDSLSYLWTVAENSEGQPQLINATQGQARVELRGAKTSIGATVVTRYRLKLAVTDCPGATSETELELSYACTGK